MSDTIITVPYPPRECRANYHPGSRGGRIAQAKATKRYRQDCWACAREAVGQAAAPRWSSGMILAHVRRPMRKFPDAANIGSFLKAAIDGLVDAGVYADDRNVNVVLASYDVDRDGRERIELVCEGPKEQT